jgi:hypothetical protein
MHRPDAPTARHRLTLFRETITAASNCGSLTTDHPSGTESLNAGWKRAGSTRRNPMHKTILTAAALVLFSSAGMAQSTDSKGPATTGPAAQSDNMSKGDMTKDKMSKKKMAKSKSTKMKKTDDKM